MNDLSKGPLVSIVMPSFNQCDYLERAILSVLNQTYSNIELIVIDGGSTDGSVDILKKYSSQLKYWESEKDRGQSHAINKGLAIAQGEWVGWQNSDDLFSLDGIQKLMLCAQRHPDATLVIGDMCMIDKDDHRIREIRYIKPTYHSILAEGMVLTNQSALWRRSIHQEVGMLDEALHYGFDYEWFLRVLKNYSAAHIAHIVGFLRIHDQTKSWKYHAKFLLEYDQILSDRKVGKIKKLAFKIRRSSIHLMSGHFSHLYRQTIYYFSKKT